MLRLAVTVFLTILGIFVHPFEPGIIDFIYRFFVFSGIIYIAYISFKANEREDFPVHPAPIEPPPDKYDIEVNLEQDWNLKRLIMNDDRTLEFIKDQFTVMGNLLMPDNGWIFLKNSDKKLEAIQYVNISGSGFPLDQDIYDIKGILQILDQSDKVLIENNIENQSSLLALYEEGKYQASSFIGIPLPLPNEQKILFCFDSGTKEHFNQEDAKIIYKIVAGIETFIVNRLKAYTLLSELNDTREQLDFAKTLSGCKTVNLALERFVDWISANFEASRLTVAVVKKDTQNAVIKKVIGQKDEFEENMEIPLDEGLTGWVIGKNKPYLIDDIEKGEYFIPRYTKSEKTNYGIHSFLGIPLVAGDQVFGAVTLEHVIPGKFTDSDKQHIQHFAAVFSTIFNRQMI